MLHLADGLMGKLIYTECSLLLSVFPSLLPFGSQIPVITFEYHEKEVVLNFLALQ